uniref:Uncharacterized protein n=1 Tax=viral metagenome TaxID=1070528 RepID=A0A6H1ZF77_9ZZZZ
MTYKGLKRLRNYLLAQERIIQAKQEAKRNGSNTYSLQECKDAGVNVGKEWHQTGKE